MPGPTSTAPDNAGDNLIRTWMRDAGTHPPNPKAWAKLVTELRIAAHLEQKQVADDRLPAGMTSIVASIVALYEFLDGHDFIKQERLHIPTARLGMALHDLGQGKRSPLFDPVGVGKTRKSTVQANVSAIAARALGEMLGNGVPLKSAALTVSRAVREGRLAGYSSCTAATVQNWRARLDEGEGSATDEALARYKAPLPDEAGETPGARAAWLLKVLRTSAVLRHG